MWSHSVEAIDKPIYYSYNLKLMSVRMSFCQSVWMFVRRFVNFKTGHPNFLGCNPEQVIFWYMVSSRDCRLRAVTLSVSYLVINNNK